MLNFYGTSHGLDDTGKLGQKPIAHKFHDTPAASGDLGLHQVFAQGFLTRERSCLVLAHQAAITAHVDGKYGSESAFHTFFAHGVPLNWNAEEVAV